MEIKIPIIKFHPSQLRLSEPSRTTFTTRDDRKIPFVFVVFDEISEETGEVKTYQVECTSYQVSGMNIVMKNVRMLSVRVRQEEPSEVFTPWGTQKINVLGKIDLDTPSH